MHFKRITIWMGLGLTVAGNFHSVMWLHTLNLTLWVIITVLAIKEVRQAN